jgi:hypothetical protein
MMRHVRDRDVTHRQHADPRRRAQLVVELLRASLQSLDTNRDSAGQFVSRACVPLETTGTRPSTFAEGPTAPARGELAPWQVQQVKAFIDANLDRPVTAKQRIQTKLETIIHRETCRLTENAGAASRLHPGRSDRSHGA